MDVSSWKHFLKPPSLFQSYLMSQKNRCILVLEQVKPGERLSNISHAVQTHAWKRMDSRSFREYGWSRNRQDLHEDPQIPALWSTSQ